MRRARFIIERHRFGATPLKADLLAGDFIVTYLLAALMMIGAVVLMSAAMCAAFWIASAAGDSKRAPAALAFVSVIAIYVAYLAVFAYLRARVGNLTLNGTIVGPLRCRSTLRARDLTWLYASNIIAVIATVGLAIPWVTIRMARYRAANLCAVGTAALASFAAAPGAVGTATGSEVGDLFDVDDRCDCVRRCTPRRPRGGRGPRSRRGRGTTSRLMARSPRACAQPHHGGRADSRRAAHAAPAGRRVHETADHATVAALWPEQRHRRARPMRWNPAGGRWAAELPSRRRASGSSSRSRCRWPRTRSRGASARSSRATSASRR
jgi:hypothetical protein